MAKIEIRGVHLQFAGVPGQDDVVALAGVDLAIHAGEFITIVGPSGCGKTSLLYMIDGLVRPTAGAIQIDGRPIQGPGPDRAMVFQEFGLLPWRTVLSNVELALELRGLPPARRREEGRAFLRLVGLDGFADHFPDQLSGGMKQRVGLARALCADPDIILMDEPFGALDAMTKEVMQKETLRIWHQTGKTVVFITHDIDESVYMASRVVVMSARPGRIKAIIPINLSESRFTDAGIKNTAEFVALRHQVWSQLQSEIDATARAEVSHV